MEKSDRSEKQIVEQINRALIDNDLLRASSILGAYKSKHGSSSETLKRFFRKIEEKKKEIDQIESCLSFALRAIEREDGQEALKYYNQILQIQPDHTQALNGIQEAKRLSDDAENIQNLLEKAHDARCRGEFFKAQDFLREILYRFPDFDAAKEFLSEIKDRINKRREVQSLLQKGDQEYRAENYEEAIQIWELISNIDSSFRDGEPLITKAKHAIWLRNQENESAQKLRDAQRAFDNQNYELCGEILLTISSESTFDLDAKILRKKIKDHEEKIGLIEIIENRVREAIEKEDIGYSKKIAKLLLELNPESNLIEEFPEIFEFE